MKKQFLETGKIVGTHGIRGMLRVQPWSDSPQFLTEFQYFYTDSSGTTKWEAVQIQPHGNIVLLKLKGIDTIEAAERLRGKVLYLDRADITLPEGRYFIEDLVGCTVYNAEGQLLGSLSDVSATGANDVWHIVKDEREYLVPAIDEVIVSVNIEAQKIVLNPMKGIFDDAN